MFCYQCEQTAQGKGCVKFGVCGKSPEAASIMDALLQVVKGIGLCRYPLTLKKKYDKETDHHILKALFVTVTNVNFDVEDLKKFVKKAASLREKAISEAKKENIDIDFNSPYLTFNPGNSVSEIVRAGEDVSIEERNKKRGEILTSLEELVMYGLKGLAAYVYHAMILGYEDNKIYEEIYKILSSLTQNLNQQALLTLALDTGKLNLKAMEILDKANTETFGHPEPTEVLVTPKKGKAILVSGHDLKDLYELLKQTRGKGINVYTHGEMLPALAYPELKKFPHLVGNYGGAWQNQQKEFEKFKGAILMTTNCIQKPKDSYKHRIFTSGIVGWPEVAHINGHDFTKLIETALNEEGFAEDAPPKKITIGFARNTVLSVADKIVRLVKEGKIRHFFLVGGCDGAKAGRNYYTQIVEKIPRDCLILTLACGKYRFNKLDLGNIEEIPRLLDIGQCNDAYSAVQIAVALARAFDTDVNSLPLSLILSWYEQKAVSILLSLLSLNIKNIRLGPSLPAFIKPEVLNILVEKFAIKPISTPEEDLKDILHEHFHASA